MKNATLYGVAFFFLYKPKRFSNTKVKVGEHKLKLESKKKKFIMRNMIIFQKIIKNESIGLLIIEEFPKARWMILLLRKIKC